MTTGRTRTRNRRAVVRAANESRVSADGSRAVWPNGIVDWAVAGRQFEWVRCSER